MVAQPESNLRKAMLTKAEASKRAQNSDIYGQSQQHRTLFVRILPMTYYDVKLYQKLKLPIPMMVDPLMLALKSFLPKDVKVDAGVVGVGVDVDVDTDVFLTSQSQLGSPDHYSVELHVTEVMN